MNKRTLIILAGIVGVVVLVAVGWYLASPLFIDDTVDEGFPSTEELATMSDEELAEVEEMVLATAASMPSTEMDEAMPEEAEPTVLSQGQFVDADDFHQGAGVATIYALPDGSHVLRFEEFMVTNGPDLHVILSSNANPTGRGDIGDDYIDLGSLKGNLGNQNYTIPADVDLSQYQSIIIYCQPFHVLFSIASLSG